MRLALLSDVHGNPIALEAVLADVEAQGGVDGYWVLGDLAAIGYDPAGAVERLAALPNARFVRGNTDRSLVEGEPGPSLGHLRNDPSSAARQIDLAVIFAWTHGHLTARGRLPWLAALPLEQRLTLPDGTRLLGVHASPGRDTGDGIRPVHTDDDLRAILAGCDAELVVVGHTHWPLDRTVDGVRVVNLGSVSNPLAPDLRAKYALLEASGAGYEIQARYVDYDLAATIQAIDQSGHPAGDFIKAYFLGQRRPPWE
jgi:predicted phosphodiesterase